MLATYSLFSRRRSLSKREIARKSRRAESAKRIFTYGLPREGGRRRGSAAWKWCDPLLEKTGCGSTTLSGGRFSLLDRWIASEFVERDTHAARA